MYQPYPSAAGQPPEPVRPAPPASVVMAVRLMYAGAVVSALSLILALIAVGSIRASLHRTSPTLTPSQLHTVEVAFVVGTVVYEVISIGLWLLMAYTNKAGKGWARIVATVLFALNTLLLFANLARGGVAAGALAAGLTWLIGAGAIVFLWRRDASEYFTANSAPR